MWTAYVRAAIYLPALVFLMWVLSKILGPILDMANSGPHADASSVQRVGGYFGALSVENLTLIALLAVAVFIIARAAVERQLG